MIAHAQNSRNVQNINLPDAPRTHVTSEDDGFFSALGTRALEKFRSEAPPDRSAASLSKANKPHVVELNPRSLMLDAPSRMHRSKSPTNPQGFKFNFALSCHDASGRIIGPDEEEYARCMERQEPRKRN